MLPVDAQTTASAPSCLGDRDGGGHAAVLERAGRVVALDLEPDLGAGEAGEPLRVHQRGAALAQGDRRRCPAGMSSRSRYSSMTPRHWWVRVGRVTRRRSFDPHHRGDLADDVHAAQVLDRGGELRVGRLVRDDDELGVVVAALLADGLDRDAVLGERGGDRGQHAGAVVDVDRDVVAGEGLPHRQHRPVGVRRLAGAAGAGEPVAGDGDQVAEHRGRGRRAAGAGAVEHQLAGGLGLDEHRVVGLAHRGQRVRPRDHRRVHADGDGVVAGLVGARRSRAA